MQFTSETRENYLRGGIIVNGAYSDNVLTSAAGTPLGDASFSIFPNIAIDQTRPRLHWDLSYSPGFTVYRRFDSYDEMDHNLAADLAYQLSPHVTLSLRDGFQKSSNAFNSPDQSLTSGASGSVQAANVPIVAPVADRLNNTGNVGITYQFAANAMVGAGGTFTNLHYANPSQVEPSNPTELFGLYDSSSRSGSAFYGTRFSKKHYLGVTYEYDDLFSYPPGLTTHTETHSIYLFYTLYATRAFSLSLFGGPQHSYTSELTQPSSQMWSPSGGASFNLQARRTALALSLARSVTGGGGLIGAAESESVNASFRQKITKNLTLGAGGGYSNRNMIQLLALPTNNGHSITGSVSLERRLGEHVAARAGYTRLRQQYQNVGVITPNTNREWVSLSYEFSRPLGR